MTITFEIPDALYEKAQKVVKKQSQTVETVLQDQLYHWFQSYWEEKAENISQADFLEILDRAPQLEPELEADRL
ncbi:MAG: hypothetical protein J0L94_14950 [Rhodothermia bacterium]|nr:hypothetical protein [Rhodothermia bacterium]